jgi:hypothetical protein
LGRFFRQAILCSPGEAVYWSKVDIYSEFCSLDSMRTPVGAALTLWDFSRQFDLACVQRTTIGVDAILGKIRPWIPDIPFCELLLGFCVSVVYALQTTRYTIYDGIFRGHVQYSFPGSRAIQIINESFMAESKF